jgi:hypothetical protein
MAQRAPRLSAATQKKRKYEELLASIDPSILKIPEISRSLAGDTMYLDLGKPPLHDLVKIFEDLSNKALEKGFEKVLDALAGRPLRVATVCSGTESPLLALEMIQQGEYHFCAIEPVARMLTGLYQLQSYLSLWDIVFHIFSAVRLFPSSRRTSSGPLAPKLSSETSQSSEEMKRKWLISPLRIIDADIRELAERPMAHWLKYPVN